MIHPFYNLEKQLLNDPGYQWLTIINKSGTFTYTYKELHSRTVDYCQLFNSRQIQSGETILIILKESIDLFAAFIAGVICGAMPAYYAYPSPKQSLEQFFDSMDNLILFNEIKLIICYSELRDTLAKKNYVNNNMLVNTSDVARSTLTEFPQNNNEFEAFLQFSSGTTGSKKGVKISSEALINQINAYKPHVQFDNNSTVISWLPHYHDMGLIACMLMPLFEKVPIVMLSPFEWVSKPVSLLENIQQYKATHTWQPNFALGHLVKSIPYEEVNNYDLSSLKKLVCCSEPVLYRTIEKFKQHFAPSNLNPEIIHNCYAMAENTFAMTVSINEKLKYLGIDYDVFKNDNKVVIKEDNGFLIASAGKPIKNTAIKILSDKNSELPENKIGSIFIKSDCMLNEYHNNPQATNESMNRGWFNTGDLGFINGEELYVVGRKKELIIVGGENIYPQDIEQILNDEDYFFEGRNVVFGVSDQRLGTEKIIALAEVSIENHENINILGLMSKIFNQLNISISDIILLPPKTLIKSTAGKISRYLNRRAYIEGIFNKHFNFQKLESSHMQHASTIKKIINQLLPSRHDIEIDDETQLFNTGLIDSFGFFELIVNIESSLNIQIPEKFKSFDNFQTIKTINKTLEQHSNGSAKVRRDKKEYFKSLHDLQSQKNIFNSQTFLEKLINYFPFKKTKIFPLFLKTLGMNVGYNVRFLGNANFKIRGKISNITIGDNVILGKNIDIRNREEGKIILINKCYIDDNVRLVSARKGKIEFGEGTEVGKGSMINSGGTLITGKYCMIASNVNINSSSHGTTNDKFIKIQEHKHGEIIIGDDVWIGSGVSVLMNSRIGDGAIISSNSLIYGNVPDFTIYAGVPGQFIRNR